MNDITALAQRMKAAAISAKELSIIARYSKGRAAVEAFIALMTPNNVLELVEALEKALRANASQDDHINQQADRIDTLERRNAELGKYAGELESRTVTVKQLLPRRKTADDYIDDTFDPSDLAAVHNACRLECEVKLKNALAAAGIQVIEGEQKNG